jgi:(S)-3,5-dihydroxyphenylglycine transaminase
MLEANSVTSVELRRVELKACFDEPILDVMNFLNEVVTGFPEAISFAPGRPLESLCELERHEAAIERFVADVAQRECVDRARVRRRLGQYSRTNGLLQDLIARQLALDEQIHVDPSTIMVTVGAQEAMAIVLAGLFDAANDILLVSDPTYIGITGLARILGIRVVAVPAGNDGIDPDDVDLAIRRASRNGRVRALYDIPDFNNPLGTSLPVPRRVALLDVCRRHGVLMIEDNAYGMFAYDHPPLPTLKALDRDASVLYIGSFSKTLSPGLRIGYLVANQRVSSTGETLAQALSRVKSLVTVNTPPILQAVVGGLLLESGGSLEPIVAPKRARYREQRTALLTALSEEFAAFGSEITWTTPSGGFFLPLTLPFEFGSAELRRCVVDHGVIACPMRLFSLDYPRLNQVRFAFSYVDPPTIREGIARFARFVRLAVRDGTASPQSSAHRSA